MFLISAIALAAAAAVAAQQPAATAVPKIVAPVEGGSPAATQPTRYCVKEATTGTRMSRKVCRTRDAWLADGFDPLAPAR